MWSWEGPQLLENVSNLFNYFTKNICIIFVGCYRHRQASCVFLLFPDEWLWKHEVETNVAEFFGEVSVGGVREGRGSEFTSWRGGAGAGTGGRTGRRSGHIRCSGTAWSLCAFGNVASARPTERSARCSPPRCSGTASLLCVFSDELWDVNSWCKLFYSPRSRTCGSSAV